jgi:hypothetical protein
MEIVNKPLGNLHILFNSILVGLYLSPHMGEQLS